jgi:ubiquinone/menaquinone biosynthesis C-methylase UbiE
MITKTAAAIERQAIGNATVRRMDAEALDFTASSFDCVLCSFAVFFFPDLARALTEIGRVLRPDGTVGFAFSRGIDSRWRWYEARLRELGAFDALPPPPGRADIRKQGELAPL